MTADAIDPPPLSFQVKPVPFLRRLFFGGFGLMVSILYVQAVGLAVAGVVLDAPWFFVPVVLFFVIGLLNLAYGRRYTRFQMLAITVDGSALRLELQEFNERRHHEFALYDVQVDLGVIYLRGGKTYQLKFLLHGNELFSQYANSGWTYAMLAALRDRISPVV